MKYQAISANKNEFGVSAACRVLGVSRSGYYEWLEREPSTRMKQDAVLTVQLKSMAAANRYVYGVPRLHAELQAQGMNISRKRVSRLMKAAHIVVKGVKPFKPRTTISDPSQRAAPNHLDRDFNATAPDQKWLADITYVATAEGFLYVSALEDVYSRMIVGLAMDDQMPTELIAQAFTMAWTQRHPNTQLLHHSDRGSQYTSKDYRDLLQSCGVISSMSRTGDCWDNAPMESFWSSLKRECADHIFATRAGARAAIFDYVFGFYNRTRRHSALGYLSPEQFEQQFERQLACT